MECERQRCEARIEAINLFFAQAHRIQNLLAFLARQGQLAVGVLQRLLSVLAIANVLQVDEDVVVRSGHRRFQTPGAHLRHN